MKWLTYEVIVSIFIRPPRIFMSREFLFENGLDKLSSALFLSNLHTKLRIINRGVRGLGTDSPCGVWSRGWITLFLYDGSRLGFCCWITAGVYVWNIEEEFSIDFLPFFSTDITQRKTYFIISAVYCHIAWTLSLPFLDTNISIIICLDWNNMSTVFKPIQLVL